MRYRVHYSVADERRTAEVEAASPHEAVVKFEHVQSDRPAASADGWKVLSVLPEPVSDDMPW